MLKYKWTQLTTTVRNVINLKSNGHLNPKENWFTFKTASYPAK